MNEPISELKDLLEIIRDALTEEDIERISKEINSLWERELKKQRNYPKS